MSLSPNICGYYRKTRCISNNFKTKLSSIKSNLFLVLRFLMHLTDIQQIKLMFSLKSGMLKRFIT